MNSICKDIFRSIHEGKWLYIEYESKDSTRKKYWIAIHDINLEYKSLSVTGLHLGEFTTKDLTIYIEKIISSEIMDGTYYKTNIELTEDIEAFPQKYSSLFSNIANLKTLNYLSDCNKLSDLPKLNTQYELVNKLDSSKITKRTYKLDDDQFKYMVNSFKKRAESRKNKNNANILQIALNVLSIHTNKNNGLYVLAYREVRLDVEAKTLIAGNKIKICSEFCVDDTQEKRTKLSILNFLDNDDIPLLDDFEKNAETIKDIITENIKNRKDYCVDDMPYFLCIQRDINANLEKEYEAITDMYAQNAVTVPIQAFFGELRSIKSNDEILPIALVDKNVNLDQLLAIHNAMNYPVAYIQGPPGTGKTTTIINTIITAFFNSKTVLFSSYNNHPIDGVFEKLTSLKYKNYTIPFPILRIGSNKLIPETCKYIKRILETIEKLNVFDDVLKQNKQAQIERTKRLTELLQKHDALSFVDFDHDKLMQFLNFTSVKFLKNLFNDEYKEFIEILDIQDIDKQAASFNKYFSNPENVEKIKKVFPVFCATCISSQKIGSPKTYFDMTIIDEASQCNTAVSLIPIIRGKNLMLVGDPQQLNPVITLDKNINEELKSKYNVSENYDYIKNSIYKSYLASDAISQETLLHNHYRCAKEIINFSNKKYYNNQLNIKSKALYDKPLVLCDIENNHSNIKNTAPEEVDKIINYVIKHKERKIGIITPFKNQKDLIEYKLKENGLEHNASCGTVHAFQGDEKDDILFSLALTENTHSKTYDWLKNNKELLNVAVSRAKDRFVMLTSKTQLERLHKKDEQDDLYELFNYVQTNGECKVSSRENSSRALGIKPYSSETESVFLTTLNHALSVLLNENVKYTVKREVQISHLFDKDKNDCDFFYKGSLDFVIYKKGFRGKEEPILAIELDGPEHKNNAKVIARDEKKKQICKNHGFDLIHVDNSYARRYNFLKDILEDFFKA